MQIAQAREQTRARAHTHAQTARHLFAAHSLAREICARRACERASAEFAALRPSERSGAYVRSLVVRVVHKSPTQNARRRYSRPQSTRAQASGGPSLGAERAPNGARTTAPREGRPPPPPLRDFGVRGRIMQLPVARETLERVSECLCARGVVVFLAARARAPKPIATTDRPSRSMLR